MYDIYCNDMIVIMDYYKFYLRRVNLRLDPLYDDPIECDDLVDRRTGQRDMDMLLATARGCVEISIPFPFYQEAKNVVVSASHAGRACNRPRVWSLTTSC